MNKLVSTGRKMHPTYLVSDHKMSRVNPIVPIRCPAALTQFLKFPMVKFVVDGSQAAVPSVLPSGC